MYYIAIVLKETKGNAICVKCDWPVCVAISFAMNVKTNEVDLCKVTFLKTVTVLKIICYFSLICRPSRLLFYVLQHFVAKFLLRLSYCIDKVILCCNSSRKSNRRNFKTNALV